MSWKQTPPELAEIFVAALPEDAAVERRKMFGYPCAFVNGNMFTGMHEHRMVLRLPENKRDEMLEVDGAARFEPTPGRVMREYVVVPPSMFEQPKVLTEWVREAFHFARGLPAKVRKKRAAKSDKESHRKK